MRTVILGQQQRGGNGRRIIGIELRVSPGYGLAQEEVYMDGLDIELPPFDVCAPALDFSVTLHTTNGDVTLDSRKTGQGIRQ